MLIQLAERNDLQGAKITQVIENTCDQKSINTEKRGRKASYYAIDDARQLLQGVSSCPSGYTRQSLDDALAAGRGMVRASGPASHALQN